MFSSITKLYAIRVNKQTIETVSLDSTLVISSQKIDQQIPSIRKIGAKTL